MKMSVFLRLIVCIAISFAISFATFPKTEKKAAFDGEIFRLHVVANSDSPYDQALKLKVRDAVLEKAGEVTANAKNADEAEELLKKNAQEIQKAANDILLKEGDFFGTYMDFGVFHFPVRHYGSVTLPEGDYNALKIIIGEGKGHNWWCVMYPPLCLLDETAEFKEESLNALSEETKKKITKRPKIEVKWKLAEIFG